MLVETLVILIIILVIANFASNIHSSIDPPCKDPLNEYLNSARKLPSDSFVNLNSIPSGMAGNYAGIKNTGVKTPDDSVSENEHESFVTPKPIKNDSLLAAVNSMFKGDSGKSSTTKKITTDFNGAGTAIFELEMEGLKVDNHRNPNQKTTPVSDNVYKTQNDGYKNMSKGAW